MYDIYHKTEFKVASLQRRVIAYLLDLAVISGATSLIFVIIYLIVPNVSDYSFGIILAVMILVIYFLSLFYFVLLEAAIGQTFGKIILGIYVFKSDMSLPSLENIVLRNLMRVLDSSANILMLLVLYSQYIGIPVFLVYPIALIALMSLTDKHQRIGDLIADTIVVQRVTTSPLVVQKPVDLISELQKNLNHINSQFMLNAIPQQTYDYYKSFYESKINEYRFLNIKRELEGEL